MSITDWQTHGETVPLIVNCQPAGEYLGEEFHRAGGVPAVMGELIHAGIIKGEAITVTGKTVKEIYGNARSRIDKVIKTVANPLMEKAGFAVMSGNIFDSAIMKKSVIDETFRITYLSNIKQPNVFEARAIVFEGPEDYHHRINDPKLAIDAHCMLIIRNCGPVGYPGSAEVVNMLPPDYLVKRGITCLPTMGDGRQSGTSASPSILNISPEAAVGGGLAYIKTDDKLRIDLNNNTVDLLIDAELLAIRKKSMERIPIVNQTPWQEIYRSRVNQLSDGGTLEMKEKHTRIASKHGIPRNSH